MASADVAQVLPKELRLGAPPQMPQARSYMFKQPSTLSSYKSDTQTTIQINLPRLQRSYLTKDSYLKFRLSVSHQPDATAKEGLSFDTPGAYGLFDKIEVFDYLGSTSLESISGFGQLMGLLLDVHTDTVESGTHNAIIDGTVGGAAVENDPTKQLIPTTGKTLIPSGSGDGTAIYYASYEFSIPLFSFLGLLSPKFAPLHNGYTIMLTLNQPYTAFVQPAAATSTKPMLPYTISEMNLHCQVLELGPVAESMLLSSTGGQPLVVHCKSFRRYTGAVKQQQEFKIPLNLNVASLTNILWFMRSKADTDSAQGPSLGNRIRAYLQNWYFQYGSSVLPQTTGIQAMAQSLGPNASNITTDAAKLAVYSDGCRENYAELLKARHAWNSATHTTQITPKSYEWDLAWPAQNGLTNFTTLKTYTQYGIGKFACGLDLELVSGKSNDLISGLNTNGMNTMIAGRFHPDYYSKQYSSGTTVDTIIMDAYAEYDAFINISPGIATTVSF